jgi:hypothetical protein
MSPLSANRTAGIVAETVTVDPSPCAGRAGAGLDLPEQDFDPELEDRVGVVLGEGADERRQRRGVVPGEGLELRSAVEGVPVPGAFAT